MFNIEIKQIRYKIKKYQLIKYYVNIIKIFVTNLNHLKFQYLYYIKIIKL